MCDRTGWTWDYVWNLSVDRIEQMEKHWRSEPPVGLLVATFMGFKKPEAVKAGKGGAQELLKMFPKGDIE